MHQGIEVIPIGIDELRVLCLAVRGDLTAQFIEAVRSAFAESRIQLQRRFSHPGQLILLIQKRDMRIRVIGIASLSVIAAVHKQNQGIVQFLKILMPADPAVFRRGFPAEHAGRRSRGGRRIHRRHFLELMCP